RRANCRVSRRDLTHTRLTREKNCVRQDLDSRCPARPLAVNCSCAKGATRRATPAQLRCAKIKTDEQLWNLDDWLPALGSRSVMWCLTTRVAPLGQTHSSLVDATPAPRGGAAPFDLKPADALYAASRLSVALFRKQTIKE